MLTKAEQLADKVFNDAANGVLNVDDVHGLLSALAKPLRECADDLVDFPVQRAKILRAVEALLSRD